MQGSTRNFLIAAIVVIVLIIIASAWWYLRGTLKFAVTQLLPVPASGGQIAAVLTGTTTSKADPMTWVGKAIDIHTKSLGPLKATVASVAVSNGAGAVTTGPIASYPAKSAYAADPSDYASIRLVW